MSVRLDQYVAEYWPEYSRSQWQKYIAAGYVTINGEIVTSPKVPLGEDDEVKVDLPTATDYSEHTLPVIYEDDNVCVINKPAGVLTHSKGAVNEEFTVAEFIRPHSTDSQENNRPGIVHRLDRDTSGVIIVAKNGETKGMLQKQFQDRRAKKTYIAVVDGSPKHAEAKIDLPIERRIVSLPAMTSTASSSSNRSQDAHISCASIWRISERLSSVTRSTEALRALWGVSVCTPRASKSQSLRVTGGHLRLRCPKTSRN
jgi:23S rRNA pseudouridine1911/1915/1917 synthase